MKGEVAQAVTSKTRGSVMRFYFAVKITHARDISYFVHTYEELKATCLAIAPGCQFSINPSFVCIVLPEIREAASEKVVSLVRYMFDQAFSFVLRSGMVWDVDGSMINENFIGDCLRLESMGAMRFYVDELACAHLFKNDWFCDVYFLPKIDGGGTYFYNTQPSIIDVPFMGKFNKIPDYYENVEAIFNNHRVVGPMSSSMEREFWLSDAGVTYLAEGLANKRRFGTRVFVVDPGGIRDEDILLLAVQHMLGYPVVVALRDDVANIAAAFSSADNDYEEIEIISSVDEVALIFLRNRGSYIGEGRESGAIADEVREDIIKLPSTVPVEGFQRSAGSASQKG